ncbi:MAG TPA: EAL domain-containing protein, partial [Acidimicrobiales bacterium]|nr:EAL domain-containing protein [Acidimicrobiales bacterium]
TGGLAGDLRPDGGVDSGAAVAVLLVALTVASLLQLRFTFRGQHEALDLFDAVLAPVIFALSGPMAVVLAGAAMAMCETIMRTRPVKLLFNMSQWMAATGAGALCYAALAEGKGVSARNLGALAVAMAVVVLVNHLAMVVVFTLVMKGPMVRILTGLRPVIRMGWALAGAVNLAFGLLMVAALDTGTWTIPLFLVPLGMLHWANRGYAESRADRARLGGLQRATHVLVGPIDPRDAIPEFLAEVRACFAVEVAELVLPEGGSYRVRRLAGPDPAEIRSWTVPADDDSLAVAVLDGNVAVRVTPSHADDELRRRLQEGGWRDCVAAPLSMRGLAVGVLAVYNRTGLEGFEMGELAVLDALARELAGALEKAELVDDVLHQALHDGLTSLPNRTLFHQRVQRAIVNACDEGNHVAVMLIDLNRFKEINDTLGHHQGDLLLQDLSARLQQGVRPTDTVARLGGDEFAVLVPRVADTAEAVQLALRVMRTLERPFVVNELTLGVNAAVGIAVYPDHGLDPATLLQKADVAMYAAKGTALGYEVYSPADDRHSRRRLALQGELRNAAATGQLRVHYQPKADLRSGQVTGVEALVRWEHPLHGSVSPEEFVPIAEQTGTIGALTSFVLEEALGQCGAWRRSGLDVGVAVNLSVRSLLDTHLPAEISRLLAETGVPADHLTLELTESSVMADPPRTADVLARLDQLGVQLSVDDYGTGYSSLSYLPRLPLDEMKIDKSFVMGMGAEGYEEVIVRSTIDLGHNLGLRVVAEGVEDAVTWQRLNDLGCDSAQGYYLSRPVPADQVIDLLTLELPA